MSKIKLSDHFTAGRLFRFVLPSVAMMVFISIYGVVDGFFVSNFAGKTSFASINLIMPFVMILGGVGFMVGTGGTALVSQKLGEGDEKTAKRYFTMMIMLTVILGAVLTTFGLNRKRCGVLRRNSRNAGRLCALRQNSNILYNGFYAPERIPELFYCRREAEARTYFNYYGRLYEYHT